MDDVKKEISKYNKLSELREQSPNFYTYIKRNKLLYLTKDLVRKKKLNI